MTPGQKLLWDMKVTAGARFNAASRLNAKDKISNISIAVYSGVVISVSMAGLAFDLGETYSKYLALITLISSIFILVLSMKVFADRNAVDAEQMHRCALEINELRRNYSYHNSIKKTNYEKVAKEYNAILQKYSINHSEKDYLKYKYNHRWEFDDLKVVDEKKVMMLEFYNDKFTNLNEKAWALVGVGTLIAAVLSLFGLI